MIIRAESKERQLEPAAANSLAASWGYLSSDLRRYQRVPKATDIAEGGCYCGEFGDRRLSKRGSLCIIVSVGYSGDCGDSRKYSRLMIGQQIRFVVRHELITRVMSAGVGFCRKAQV